MARFAGEFSPIQLSAGASGGNYSAAAGAVDIGNSFGAQREKAPRYDQLSARAMETAAEVEAQALKSEADVMSTGLTALGSAKEGQLAGQASVKAAKAAAAAKQSTGMMSTFGGLLGTGMKLLSGGIG